MPSPPRRDAARARDDFSRSLARRRLSIFNMRVVDCEYSTHTESNPRPHRDVSRDARTPRVFKLQTARPRPMRLHSHPRARSSCATSPRAPPARSSPRLMPSNRSPRPRRRARVRTWTRRFAPFVGWLRSCPRSPSPNHARGTTSTATGRRARARGAFTRKIASCGSAETPSSARWGSSKNETRDWRRRRCGDGPSGCETRDASWTRRCVVGRRERRSEWRRWSWRCDGRARCARRCVQRRWRWRTKSSDASETRIDWRGKTRC